MSTLSEEDKAEIERILESEGPQSPKVVEALSAVLGEACAPCISGRGGQLLSLTTEGRLTRHGSVAADGRLTDLGSMGLFADGMHLVADNWNTYGASTWARLQEALLAGRGLADVAVFDALRGQLVVRLRSGRTVALAALSAADGSLLGGTILLRSEGDDEPIVVVVLGKGIVVAASESSWSSDGSFEPRLGYQGIRLAGDGLNPPWITATSRHLIQLPSVNSQEINWWGVSVVDLDGLFAG